VLPNVVHTFNRNGNYKAMEFQRRVKLMIADIISSLIYDIYEFVKFATENFNL